MTRRPSGTLSVTCKATRQNIFRETSTGCTPSTASNWQESLRRLAAGSATALRVLLQVNIASDPGKSGLPATALFRFIDELLRAELDGLEIRGLMTIGQRDATARQRRRDFSALYELGQQCAGRYGSGLFREYSMGMSGDFEDAIAEGATMIRIGSAIFGPRPFR